LNLSLERFLGGGVEDLYAISGGDSNTIAKRITLIEIFTHASSIVSWDSSVLHELNVSAFKGRSTLGSIVHNSELFAGRLVSHRDSRLNWEIVGGDVLKGVLIVFVDKIPGWSIVENSLLHFETIGIGVEGLVVIHAGVEIGNNLKAIIIDRWETSKVDLKFDDTFQISIKGNMDNDLLEFFTVHLVDSMELEIHLSIRHAASYKGAVVHCLVFTCDWSENVITGVLSTDPCVIVDERGPVFHAEIEGLR